MRLFLLFFATRFVLFSCQDVDILRNYESRSSVVKDDEGNRTCAKRKKFDQVRNTRQSCKDTESCFPVSVQSVSLRLTLISTEFHGELDSVVHSGCCEGREEGTVDSLEGGHFSQTDSTVSLVPAEFRLFLFN